MGRGQGGGGAGAGSDRPWVAVLGQAGRSLGAQQGTSRVQAASRQAGGRKHRAGRQGGEVLAALLQQCPLLLTAEEAVASPTPGSCASFASHRLGGWLLKRGKCSAWLGGEGGRRGVVLRRV